jgi:hypothetical protein
VITCPAAVTGFGAADFASTDFTTLNPGAGAPGTVRLDGPVVIGLGFGVDADAGGVPLATAESVIEPAPTSAAVTVYVPVNNATCPGTNVVVDPEHVPDGDDNDTHVGPDVNTSPVNACVSVTDTFANVVDPVSVTLKS